MVHSKIADREFVLNFQADLVLKDFLRFYLREKKRAFFFIPTLKYGFFDFNGNTVTDNTFLSDRFSFCPSETVMPSWNNYNICDPYYREIISQHLYLDGDISNYHQKHICYVKEGDQQLLCDLIAKKLYDNNFYDVKVYFERAFEKGFIFKKDLGYSYLCLSR